MQSPRVPALLAALACTLVAESTRAQEPAAAPAPSYGLSGGWGGMRDSLAEHGFAADFSLTFEANRVLSGGVEQRTTGHALYDLTLNFDLDRIAGWKDGTFSVEAYVVDGHDPSQDVGDYQSFSDISGEERAEVAQVYYEQWFAEKTLRLKFGKMDANNDFGAPGSGTESIHSGSAYSPTTFAMVTYPDPAAGILAGWVPNERWSLNVGMYDGAAVDGVRTGSLGPASFFRDPPGYLYLGEIGRRWKLGGRELAGGITLGAWRHTGEFANAFGGTTHNTSGFYGTFDQELSRAAEGEGGGTKSVFLQYGSADQDVAPVDRHYGLGFHWAGCCSARPDDALGVYVSRVHFSPGAGFTEDAETVYELSYLLQCCKCIALRPDLQYVENPGGDASIDDATVFSLRLEFSF